MSVAIVHPFKNVRDFLKDEFGYRFNPKAVLAFHFEEPEDKFFNDLEVYVAARYTDNKVHAAILKVSHKLVNGEENLWDSDLFHEEDNPPYYNCPQKILDFLDTPTNKKAAKWREKCKENLGESQSPTM